LQKYTINISKDAIVDIKGIVTYIKDTLKEPIIAIKYSKLIKEKIYSLEYSPERYGIIDDEHIKIKDYRKLVIKKHIAIYRVDTQKNIVHIARIIYGGMDWQNMLKKFTTKKE